MARSNMTATDGAGPAALGMNCADDPSDINANAYQKLINATVRSGRPQTRPAFVEKELTFSSTYVENVFTTGKFQGCRQYANTGKIVAAVAGHVFTIDIGTFEVTEVAASIGLMSRFVDRMYFLDAGRYFIVQDGLNIPIIFDNGVARKSDQQRVTPYPPDEGTSFKGEVPIGTHMATGQGRIAVALPNSGQFVVSDIALPDDPGNMLMFTETDYPFSGGAFKIPESFGNVTGMTFQPTPDTSLGHGPLIVSGLRGMSWYDITKPREEWITSDISRSITVSHGTSSGWAMFDVNSDVVFYSRGEARTLKQSVAEERTVVSQPYSREVRCWFKDNDPDLDDLVYGMYHDERGLFTVGPEIIGGEDWRGRPITDIRFKGMVALDFQRVGGLESTDRPAYDGLWTGIHPTGMCSFRQYDRGFAFGKGDDFVNRLYEITDDHFDNLNRRIVSRIYPRRFGFLNEDGVRTATAPKRFRGMDVWISELHGKTRISGKYRADDRREWSESGGAAAHATAILPESEPFENIAPRAMQRISLGGPDTSKEDEETCASSEYGYEFDTCLQIDGYAKVRMIFARATLDSTENFHPSTCQEEAERPNSALVEDDYDYSIQTAELAHE